MRHLSSDVCVASGRTFGTGGAIFRPTTRDVGGYLRGPGRPEKGCVEGRGPGDGTRDPEFWTGMFPLRETVVFGWSEGGIILNVSRF